MLHDKGYLVIKTLALYCFQSTWCKVLYLACAWRCVSGDETFLWAAMISEHIQSLDRNGNQVTLTVVYDLVAHPRSDEKLLLTRTNQTSLISLPLKLNANLTALSRPPQAGALILTDSCRKWKTGHFVPVCMVRGRWGVEAWPFSLEVFSKCCYSGKCSWLCSVMGLGTVSQ